METIISTKVKIGIVFLIHIAIVIYAYLMWPELSEKIPSHFNFQGQVDGYAGKNSIWIIIFVGVFASMILLISTRFPQFFNFPFKFKLKQKTEAYEIMNNMMKNMAIIVTLLCSYIALGMIKIDLGDWTALSGPILYVLLGLILLLPLFTTTQLNKYKANG